MLLLLVVLLPVRGAVAAAMLCPVAGSGLQTELRLTDQPVGDDAVDSAATHHPGAEHDHEVSGHGDVGHQHSASDACNMCSAYCSLTPLLSALPALPEPPDLKAVYSVNVFAPPPTFVPDGQERPPRTI